MQHVRLCHFPFPTTNQNEPRHITWHHNLNKVIFSGFSDEKCLLPKNLEFKDLLLNAFQIRGILSTVYGGKLFLLLFTIWAVIPQMASGKQIRYSQYWYLTASLDPALNNKRNRFCQSGSLFLLRKTYHSYITISTLHKQHLAHAFSHIYLNAHTSTHLVQPLAL